MVDGQYKFNLSLTACRFDLFGLRERNNCFSLHKIFKHAKHLRFL